ncbi:MAG: hypothetical protein CMJ20_01545 [Phycisphaeraceae bacterium]|nr:hypothetical protein [Phycisphaeraceae bacterium]
MPLIKRGERVLIKEKDHLGEFEFEGLSVIGKGEGNVYRLGAILCVLQDVSISGVTLNATDRIVIGAESIYPKSCSII